MIPPRLIRTTAQARINPNQTRTARDQQRRDQILDAALALLTSHPRHTITIATLATGMIVAPATIRRHFLNIDSIIAEILQNHLRALIKTIGEIPADCVNLRQLRRKAYLAATRNLWRHVSDTHALLLREAQSLPEDLASAINQMRCGIGYTLGGERGHDMLQMLDTAWQNHALIEPMCAAIETTAQQSLPDAPDPEPAENPGNARQTKAGFSPTVYLTAADLGIKPRAKAAGVLAETYPAALAQAPPW